ncbi:hypothetical protein [Zavarzinella formosa]|uniref:hypothetical protein n=1 Tax=Zavarzinella formosa TaxID=360055 RepID=UPI0002D2F473|nr:hypothetical protein [Zavarzinella formosa]
MIEESTEDEQKKALEFFLLLMLLGAIAIVPYYVVKYTRHYGGLIIRFVLNLIGWSLGKRWFRSTQHLIWQTNFVAMPPNDDDLARWFGQQPYMVTAEVKREPNWITFDCVRRGYFLEFNDIQKTSTRAARSLGYNTGQSVSIINIKE